MSTPAKNKTYHAGAAAERKAILAKVRQQKRGWIDVAGPRVLDDLIAWILKRHERYSKRKGGL